MRALLIPYGSKESVNPMGALAQQTAPCGGLHLKVIIFLQSADITTLPRKFPLTLFPLADPIPQVTSPAQMEQDLYNGETVPISKTARRFAQRKVCAKKALRVSTKQRSSNQRSKPRDKVPKAVRIAAILVGLLGTDSPSEENLQYQDYLLEYFSTLSKEVRKSTNGLQDDSLIIYGALILLLRLRACKPGQHLGEGLDLFSTAYILSFKYLAAGYGECPWNLDAWHNITGKRHDPKRMVEMDLTMCKDLKWDFGFKSQLLEFRRIIELDYDKGVEMVIYDYL